MSEKEHYAKKYKEIGKEDEHEKKLPRMIKGQEALRDKKWSMNSYEQQEMADELEKDHLDLIMVSLDLLAISTDPSEVQLLQKLRVINNCEDLSRVLPQLFQKLELEHDFLKHDQPGWDGNWLIQRHHSFLDMNKAFQRGCNHEAEMVQAILQRLQKLKCIGSNFNFRAQHTGDLVDVIGPQLGHRAVMVYDESISKKYPQLVIDPWVAAPSKPFGMFHKNTEQPNKLMNDKPPIDERWEQIVAAEESLRKLTEKQQDLLPLFRWIQRINKDTKQEEQERQDFSSSYSLSDKWKLAESFLRTWSEEHEVDNSLITPAEYHDYLFMKYFASPNAELRNAISGPYFASMKAKIAFFLSKEGGGELSAEEVSSIFQCRTMDELQEFASIYFRKFYRKSLLVQEIFGNKSHHSVSNKEEMGE